MALKLCFFLLTLFACLSTCSGRDGGWVVAWGNSGAGQVTGVATGNWPAVSGDSTGVVKTAFGFLSNAVSISIGMSHSLALTSDGSVVGWGQNLHGEATGSKTSFPPGVDAGPVVLGGKQVNGIKAISAGWDYSLALRSNGTVVAWGDMRGPSGENALELPPGLSNVLTVAAGYDEGLAATGDGKLIAWGYATRPPPVLNEILAVAARPVEYGFSLALRYDESVVQWSRGVGRVAAPAGLSNVVQVASGWGHRLALMRDGRVFGWGGNASGEATGIPTKIDAADPNPNGVSGVVILEGQVLTNVVSVAAGNHCSLALKRDGSIAAWGGWYALDSVAVPSGLSNIVAIAAGNHFCLAITTNRLIAERFGAK